MKKKALSAVLLTAAFGLVSCTDPVVSSTTSTGGDETSSTTSTGGDETSSTTSNPPAPTPLSAAEALEALQGELAYTAIGHVESLYEDGTLDEDYSYDTDVEGYLGVDEWYSSEYNPTTGETYVMHFFKNSEGMAERRQLFYDNTVMTVPVEDYEGNPIPFTDYENPFLGVTVDQLEGTDGHYVINLDDEAAAVFALSLWGYGDILLKTITVDCDTEGLVKVTADSGMFIDAYGYNARMWLEMTITTKDALGIPSGVPYPTLDGHAELAEAFAALAKGNYTFTYVDHDPTGEYPDVSYKVVQGDDIITVEPIATETLDVPYAYVETEAGVASCLIEDGKLVSQEEPNEGTTFADIIATFAMAPELYKPEGDGRYTLQPEGATYVFLNDPSLVLGGDNLTFLDVDTYEFIINGDGTYTIKWDYTIDLFGFTMTDEVTIEITDVGTSVPAYTMDDYVEYVAPTTWEEALDAETYEGLSSQLGDDPSILPFFPSSMYNGNNLYASYFNGTRIELNLEDISEDGQAELAAYVALLEEAGWSTTNGETYTHPLGEGKSAEILVWVDTYYGVSLIIEVSDPVNNNVMTQLLTSLATDLNSTVVKTINWTDYAIDEQTGLATETVLATGTVTQTNKWGDGTFASINTEENALEDFVMEETADGLVTYSKNADTGAWEASEPDSYYDEISQVVYGWSDLDYVGALTMGDETGTYIDGSVDQDFAQSWILTFFDGWFSADEITVPFVIHYDDVAGTLEMSMTLTTETTTDDGEAASRVSVYTLEVSDIGTTVVDIPTVTPAA